jgi:nucleoside-diphosphate-sugar epimerase
MSELITLTGITGFVGMRIAEQALNNGTGCGRPCGNSNTE